MRKRKHQFRTWDEAEVEYRKASTDSLLSRWVIQDLVSAPSADWVKVGAVKAAIFRPQSACGGILLVFRDGLATVYEVERWIHETGQWLLAAMPWPKDSLKEYREMDELMTKVRARLGLMRAAGVERKDLLI